MPRVDFIPLAIGDTDLRVQLNARYRLESLRLSRADLLSIEASFILFLFSGRYKTMPELSWFPADPTAAFLVLTLVLVVFGFASGRLQLPSFGIAGIGFLLFSELAALSLFWSSLGPLNSDKLQRFLLLTAPSFFIAGILGEDPQRRLRMLRLTFWLSVGLVGYYYYYRFIVGVNLVDANGDAIGRVTAGGDTYLEYGSHAAILFIVFLASAMLRPWFHFWPALAGMACTLLALADIGGRGPLAIAIMAVPLAALAILKRGQNGRSGLFRIIVLLGLLCVAGLTVLTTARISGTELRTLDRYELQVSNEDTSSMDERTQGQEVAYRMWLQRPILGWGIGEFRVYDSYLNYPHNLLLEILMELGMAGGVLFAVVVASATRRCVLRINHPEWNWVDASYALLFVTELVAHLTVQGYLAEDRIFFSFVATNLVVLSGPSLQRGHN